MQFLVMQRAILDKAKNIFNLFHDVNHFNIFSDNLRLNTMLLVASLARDIKLLKVWMNKSNYHFAAKIRQKSNVRNFGNTIFIKTA